MTRLDERVVCALRIMIVGAGDIGMPIIHYLSERGHLLTVIESDEEKCRGIVEHSDAAIFNGSGADTEIWKNIEADKMDALLVLTNDDEINLRVCQIAKNQFGIPFVIARAHQPENIEKIKEAGADVVICPSKETRRLFLNALESLTAETLYEHTTADFKIVKVTIPPNGSIIGKTIDQLGIPEECRIIGIFRNGEIVYPTRSFVFKGKDRVLLSGSFKFVEKIMEELRNVELT
ncbi:MAG: potassium channel family protein [Candidatus Bathycorpusculaceae bacterium]